MVFFPSLLQLSSQALLSSVFLCLCLLQVALFGVQAQVDWLWAPLLLGYCHEAISSAGSMVALGFSSTGGGTGNVSQTGFYFLR